MNADMDMIDVHRTLADLVDERPALASLFEQRGLDYCCGGGQTFADACTSLGLDPRAVAAESSLAPSVAPGEWTDLGMEALVDHLVGTHHRYLWDALPRLANLVDKVVGVHGTRHAELHAIANTFGEIRADLEPHLRKEEQVLFPMIRELAGSASSPSFHCGTLRNPISVMLREHDGVGHLLLELRRLTDGYRPPADGCASYRALFAGLEELAADTHLHIHKENNVLFPMVVSMEAELANR